MSDDDPNPVLWVSVTSTGAGDTEQSLSEVEETVREAFGGTDYEVVVASDKVRLATQEDIQRLAGELSRLSPGDVEEMPEDAEDGRGRP